MSLAWFEWCICSRHFPLFLIIYICNASYVVFVIGGQDWSFNPLMPINLYPWQYFRVISYIWNQSWFSSMNLASEVLHQLASIVYSLFVMQWDDSSAIFLSSLWIFYWWLCFEKQHWLQLNKLVLWFFPRVSSWLRLISACFVF